MWLFFAAIAVSFPNALALAASASRWLWRARRRSRVWTPVAVLVAATCGFPSLASFSGFAPEIFLWSIPIGFSVSAGFSVCLILFTPALKVPVPSPIGEEQHAYSRDVSDGAGDEGHK
jgi:hypothetical protein